MEVTNVGMDSCGTVTVNMFATPGIPNGDGTTQYSLGYIGGDGNIRLILSSREDGVGAITYTPGDNLSLPLISGNYYWLGLQHYCLVNGGWVGMSNYFTKFLIP